VSKDLRKSEHINKLYESLKKPPEISHIENQNYERADTLVSKISKVKNSELFSF